MEENLTKLEQIQKLDYGNEKTAIGHMLLDENASISGIKMLQAKYFLSPHASHIFRIIKSHIEEGKTVSDILYHIKSITDEDWKVIAPKINEEKASYISSCQVQAIAFLGSSIVAEGIFNKIQDQYLRRNTIEKLQSMYSEVLNTANENELKSIVNQGTHKITDILDGLAQDKEYNYKESILLTLNRKTEKGISTGYKGLDNIIDGLKAGKLITIAAGTGIGKSAFAANLALNVAKQCKVGFWSFEMDEHEVNNRIINIKTGYSDRYIKKREERYNLAKKYLEETKDNIQIFTERITDLSSFYLTCRRMSIRENMKVVIIDYLQLINLSIYKHKDNKNSQIECITNTLKNYASELGITIIILSQLSRAHHKREDKTPQLYDLRDSGSIEQDSNIVIFLHKPETQLGEYHGTDKKIMELIVAKHREGGTGTVFMEYQGYITKFKEIEGEKK